MQIFSDLRKEEVSILLDQYRGLPFWCWNGKLDKAEIVRQVHVLKDMGFRGFFMHSRTGLETEYLGQEWFEIVTTAAQEAKKLGSSEQKSQHPHRSKQRERRNNRIPKNFAAGITTRPNPWGDIFSK